ncbi:MAG: hypothetical protein CR986_08605 [Ignavibacteriae bacterium]|nr:MAG: hypothetical protein CR986_08605 [Ignavibacteriota bacterium]
MKKLDFQPVKSKQDFRKNYRLHDLAEYHGKNLLTQWGIDFKDFGKDKRYERVWEKGDDKPDIAAEFENIKFLIDWKGKSKNDYWVNKRAVESYKRWSKKLNVPIIVCFFIFNKDKSLQGRKFAMLSKHNYKEMNNKAWDKNNVVKFEKNLPKFAKLELYNSLNNNIQK